VLARHSGRVLVALLFQNALTSFSILPVKKLDLAFDWLSCLKEASVSRVFAETLGAVLTRKQCRTILGYAEKDSLESFPRAMLQLSECAAASKTALCKRFVDDLDLCEHEISYLILPLAIVALSRCAFIVGERVEPSQHLLQVLVSALIADVDEEDDALDIYLKARALANCARDAFSRMEFVVVVALHHKISLCDFAGSSKNDTLIVKYPACRGLLDFRSGSSNVIAGDYERRIAHLLLDGHSAAYLMTNAVIAANDLTMHVIAADIANAAMREAGYVFYRRALARQRGESSAATEQETRGLKRLLEADIGASVEKLVTVNDDASFSDD
jgi:hypothetical protein